MKKIIFSLLLIILVSACSNKISIQKRRYNKGFHFSVSTNHAVKTQPEYAIQARSIGLIKEIQLPKSQEQEIEIPVLDQKVSVDRNSSSLKGILIKKIPFPGKYEKKSAISAKLKKRSGNPFINFMIKFLVVVFLLILVLFISALSNPASDSLILMLFVLGMMALSLLFVFSLMALILKGL